MRFGQKLLKLAPDDPPTLNLLAEIDVLFGDVPAAVGKWRRLLDGVAEAESRGPIEARMTEILHQEEAEVALIDELESVAEAIELHLSGDNPQALALLERIDEQGRLPKVLPSANFYCLLAYCRRGCGDYGGAVVALHKALEIEPDHAAAIAALDID
jgi:cytochrome c-type biogenesis protein CcmH/NrfG